MHNEFTDLIDRQGLTTFPAGKVANEIPADAIGIAVVHAPGAGRENVFLVLDSRAKSLRDLCLRRLETATFPAGAKLAVSFKLTPPADATPEAVHAACREQVLIASELRRALRPAMR